MTTKQILGVRFFSGSPTEAVEAGLRGGLVVVPSAPVLVGIEKDLALRAAVLGADLAITDSGLMVLMWRLLNREKLERVSGLEYLKLLLERLRTQPQLLDGGYSLLGGGPAAPPLPDESYPLSGSGTNNKEPVTNNPASKTDTTNPQPITENASGVFWVMPTAAARDRNLAWLRSQGHPTTADDCYVAPKYEPVGPLIDEALLLVIRERRPAHIIIALGGGVQERVGYALSQALTVPRLSDEGYKLSGAQEAQLSDGGYSLSGAITNNASKPITNNPAALAATDNEEPVTNNCPVYRPGIHCIGAAIGFLSGEQVNIPPWADYFYLGWLFRSLSQPAKFIPRYWRAKRLVWLMIRYGAKAPVGGEPGALTQRRKDAR
jgi:UDP-N-acetyl-D-mannosaminuronic acid transferase (WecB/TagA/CpsF family)